MKKSVSLWLPKFKALDKGEVTDQESTDPVEVRFQQSILRLCLSLTA